MKRFIVAVSLPFAKNFRTLPPFIELSHPSLNEKFQIVFHTEPRMEVAGTSVNKNFDILITGGEGIESFYNHQSVVNLRRYPKSQQAFMLAKKSKELGLDHILYIPKFYKTLSTNSNKSDKIYDFTTNITSTTVVKAELGARGLYHAVVPSNLLSHFLDNKTKKLKELVDLFPTVKFGKMAEDTEYLEKAVFNEHDLSLSEFVGVNREFRLIYSSKQDSLMYERELNKSVDGYSQANLNLNEPIKDIQSISTYDFLKILHDRNELNLSNMSFDKFYDKFTDLLESVVNFGSVDLFIRNKTLGIFEYCNEFAFYGLSPAKIRDLHVQFVVKELSKRGFI